MKKLNMAQIAGIVGIIAVSVGVSLFSTIEFGIFTFGAALLFLGPIIFIIFEGD